MKTYSAKPSELDPRWHLVDASGQVLGRLASRLAVYLRGKHKPIYTPHVDTGDYVVVINAEKVVLSGSKETDKIYYRHSGYPGGIKATSAKALRESHPERLLQLAVKNMLPNTPLGRSMRHKLKVYSGTEHPHQAQKPEPLEL
ncbi:MAG: 50S ribosomal protein L13 [Gammaproteobacteria bacterium AqS3]|nr:50S ribosomal protein L13 [Gammaproteobacteria bacterium AqS3]